MSPAVDWDRLAGAAVIVPVAGPVVAPPWPPAADTSAPNDVAPPELPVVPDTPVPPAPIVIACDAPSCAAENEPNDHAPALPPAPTLVVVAAVAGAPPPAPPAAQHCTSA